MAVRRFTEGVIDLTVRIAEWLLHRRGYHLDRLGMSKRDVALDAVAELLVPWDCMTATPLFRALDGGAGSAVRPDDADGFGALLRAILIRTLDNALTRIFADIDPTHARMLRTLRQYARRTPTLTMTSAIAGRWYHHGSVADARFDLPSIPLHDLRFRIMPGASPGNPALVMLHSMLAALDAQDEYRRAVAERDVIQLALERAGSELGAVLHASEQMAEPQTLAPLLDATEAALLEIRDWLDRKYRARGKLTAIECVAFAGAIRRYVRDAADGDPESHFHYLAQHLPGLGYEHYRREYRNTFDYVLRRFFTTAQEALVSLGYERLVREERIDDMDREDG